MVVGESEVLNLTARANPGPVLYTWTRHGIPLPEPVIDDSWRHSHALDPDTAGGTGASVVAADGPLLYIRGVTVADAGDYELEATNQEGATVAKVYLNVQCKWWLLQVFTVRGLSTCGGGDFLPL